MRLINLHTPTIPADCSFQGIYSLVLEGSKGETPGLRQLTYYTKRGC